MPFKSELVSRDGDSVGTIETAQWKERPRDTVRARTTALPRNRRSWLRMPVRRS
jgi:hypothetical protein